MYIRRFSGEEGIIMNPQVFDPSYLPEELPFREEQLSLLASEITMFVKHGKITNLLLYGPPGTGKTATLQKIMSEARAVFPVKTVYINAWKYRTAMSVLTEVASALEIGVPVRGVSKERVLHQIEEKMSDEKIIIAVDEADRLSNFDFLYDLSRTGAMLITVANSLDFLYNLDPRILSTLFSIRVEYNPYTVPQLTEILRKRAEIGLYPNTWDEEVLRACAAVGFSHRGDARVSINCLYNAARLAEREGKSRISLEDVRKVKNVVERPLDVDPRYRKILQILESEGPLTVRELYERYTQYLPISMRAFRNYLKELSAMGLIYFERMRQRGNVRKVFLSLDGKNIHGQQRGSS